MRWASSECRVVGRWTSENLEILQTRESSSNPAVLTLYLCFPGPFSIAVRCQTVEIKHHLTILRHRLEKVCFTSENVTFVNGTYKLAAN
jgi:hypothetical protein